MGCRTLAAICVTNASSNRSVLRCFEMRKTLSFALLWVIGTAGHLGVGRALRAGSVGLEGGAIGSKLDFM